MDRSADEKLIGVTVRITSGKGQGQHGYIKSLSSNNRFSIQLSDTSVLKRRHQFRRDNSSIALRQVINASTATGNSDHAAESPDGQDNGTRKRSIRVAISPARAQPPAADVSDDDLKSSPNSVKSTPGSKSPSKKRGHQSWVQRRVILQDGSRGVVVKSGHGFYHIDLDGNAGQRVLKRVGDIMLENRACPRCSGCVMMGLDARLIAMLVGNYCDFLAMVLHILRIFFSRLTAPLSLQLTSRQSS